MTTWLPIDPVVAERPVMTGACVADGLIDTLSKVAVPRADVLLLVTAKPMYTFCAMLIVSLTIWTQLTSSGDIYPVNVFPLLVTSTQ
jgi:hypothetical protein